MRRHRGRRILLALAAIGVGTLLLSTATPAGADTSSTVTFVATQKIPVPPASNYAGAGGGDGWGIALTPTGVYQIYHHSSILQLACHKQSDATLCSNLYPETIRDADGNNFASQGQPGLYLDQATGKLYVFATRTSDHTGGVVCMDTTISDTNSNPFCGFTALTGAGESTQDSGISNLGGPALVGSRWFSFNFASGQAVGGSNGTGAQNKMLCFDVATLSPCAGEPYAVTLGQGSIYAGGFPDPAEAAIGHEVIFGITVGNSGQLACFDGVSLGNCSGWSGTVAAPGYPSSNGAPFPLLSATGALQGFCLPNASVSCFDLAGNSVATPSGLQRAMGSASDGWNGPAVVIGARVYVPNGNTNQVHCYDYSTSNTCANPAGGDAAPPFPKSFDQLGYLYTVNPDPQRPDCIWVNADNGGKQIQNFDAYTGGPCGQGAIRVFAATSVVNTPLCTPGAWNSLQITSPDRSAYTDGSVTFLDFDGNPIPGLAARAIDATGTVDLSGLNFSGSGLPQFLITLNGTQGSPGEVDVKLTWTGTYDASCLTQPGTTVPNPPAGAPSGTPAPPAKTDVSVSLTAPLVPRVNVPLTITAHVANAGPDASTGIILTTPVPSGATLTAASSTIGPCSAGASKAICYIGTLASGQAADVTMTLRTPNAGPMTVSSSAQADHDTNFGNNSAGTTMNVLAQGAAPPPPPPPAAPGTFNAVVVGTVLVNGVLMPTDTLIVLHSGDTVDVTNGIITFTGSDGQFITVSGAPLTAQRRLTRVADDSNNLPAQFTLDEPATAGSMTTLTLTGGDFGTCTLPRLLAKPSKANKTPVRQLWTSGKGSFTTKSRYASATVRGTVWLTQDRCDGSLVTVVTDAVDVLDIPLNKTVTVPAGQSYLALAPSTGTFTPPLTKPHGTPRQTPAQVRKLGLKWGAHRYPTRTAFTKYLTKNSYTWQQFAKAFPRLAKALAKRHR